MNCFLIKPFIIYALMITIFSSAAIAQEEDSKPEVEITSENSSQEKVKTKVSTPTKEIKNKKLTTLVPSDENADSLETETIEENTVTETKSVKEETYNLDTSASDSDALIEKSEVISSRLKNIDLAGPSPELRFSAEDLMRSGHNSLTDFLRDRPVSGLGSRRERSGFAATAGAATIDLRGMGSANTLVLVNGIRFPPMSGSDSVDVNRIPVAIIKEVIIIKDDLSSIYGSDAIGGVVNIITHSNFDGFKVSMGRTWTSLGGGEKLNLNLLAGSSSAKSNITFALGYRKNDKLFARDREWSNNGVSTTGSPGSYRDVGTTPWQTDPNCAPGDVIDAGPQGQFCGFNFAAYSTTIPDIEQTTIYTRMDHKFSEFTTLSSDFFYNRSRTSYTYAPAPGFFNVPAAVADTYGLPGHTNGNDLEVRYRVLELGNRDSYQENNFFGINSKVKHDFLDTWSVTLGGSYGRDRNDDIGTGNAVQSDLVALIESGAFRPFDPVGTRGDISSALYEPTSTQVATFYTADLKFSGEIFELFGSPFVIDFGTNYIFRNYNNKVDKLTLNGKTFTGAGSDGAAERHVLGTYAQLNGRVGKSLDIYLSGRHDNFSDFGETFNPKLGLKFRPTDNLILRSTVGTGFKAPSLDSLYGNKSESFETFIDFQACEQEKLAGGATPSCAAQQYRVLSGGNENLDEITSFSYSAGIVYEPSQDFNVSADFWAINQKGVIIGGSGATLQNATRAEVKGVNPGTYGFLMNRDVNGYLDPNNPIEAPLVNLQDSQTAGLDIAFSKSVGLPVGKLTVANDISLRLWDSIIPFPGLEEQDRIAENLDPKWRNNLSFNYSLLQNNFSLSAVSTDKRFGTDQATQVDSFTRFDFSYRYNGFKDTELVVGVINLLGEVPPLDQSDPNNLLNDELYSHRGREIYMNLTKTF